MEKGPILYEKLLIKYKAMFISEHRNKTESLLLLLAGSKHRVSAVANYCRNNCTVSFVLCKAVTRPYDLYFFLCKGNYSLVQQSNQEGLKYEQFINEVNKEKLLDWRLLCDFAVGIRCDDPLLLMGHYISFTEPVDSCKNCNQREKVHRKFHAAHHENAKLFAVTKTQKNSCQQACDWVLAQRRLQQRTATREQLMIQKFADIFERMEDLAGDIEILEYMAGVAWLSLLQPHFDELIVDIIKTLVQNTPKNRNIAFIGPFNSGKTTVAAAIMDLLGGTTLNVNCPSEKINFELGCATDRFMVVFEDVKGVGNNDLVPGPGVTNLDNLRDYLDGCVEVNLERKHCNKVSQIFPPALLTMNEYNLPKSLSTRFKKKVYFTIKPSLKKSLDANLELLRKRIPQSGVTLLMLLLWWQPVSAFSTELHEKVKYWKETISKYCTMDEFNKMTINIQNGIDPLNGLVESSPENSQEDSCYNTQ